MKIGLSQLWKQFQPSLFPPVAGQPELTETSEGHRRVVLILDNIHTIFREVSQQLIPDNCKGRTRIDRFSFLAAFVAMKVLNITSVKALIDRLKVDAVLRRICCFANNRSIPCEATFSNVFREFADAHLPEKIHEEMIRLNLGDSLVENVSRDSTAIEVREKPISKPKKEKSKSKRGRPRKGQEQPQKEVKRISKQPSMTLEEMIKDLPAECDKGGKKDAKGNANYWHGYKLHIDTIDGDVPVSAIITSASVHDSQVAIPLEEMTSKRLVGLYSLMDAAYDSPEIKAFVESKGKVPVIDHNRRQGEKIPFDPPKKERYKHRTAAERVNSNLKDNYGARNIRVRGAVKVMSHLSVGLLAMAVEQLLKMT